MRVGYVPRAVVDTNLVVSGFLSRRAAPFLLLRAWEERRFTGVLSPSLRAEYDKVVQRPELVDQFKLTADEIRDFFIAIESSSEHVDPSGDTLIPLRDPNDEMVLATAIAGNAEFIVTGDRDLLDLRDDPRLGRLRIVTAAEFLADLGDLE